MQQAPPEHRLDYTIILPMFENPNQVRDLISDIHEFVPPANRPKEILIVNDGSVDEDCQFLGQNLTTSLIPVRQLDKEHDGFALTAKYGADRVQTEYAVLMHSDVRLKGRLMFYKPHKIIRDAPGVCVTYLSGTEEEVFAVGVVALEKESPIKIYGGVRNISKSNVPNSRLSGYYFDPIKESPKHEWFSAISLDTYCVAFRMSRYKEYPFDAEFGHHFFFDDWCLHHRKNGGYVYSTTDSIVLHSIKTDRPDDSSAIPNEYSKALVKWQDKWVGSDFTKQFTAETVVEREEIVPR